jgi:tRNA(fMet)-specific endonuclease VapC
MAALRYLLDTNIVSAIIKQPASPLAKRIAAMHRETFCTSIVVASELRFGAHRKGSAKLTQQVEAVLEGLDIIPLEEPVDQHYASIRVELARLGQPIGQNDLFIAAHARALGLILVTNNVREFSRVPGLTVENWLG